MKLRLIFYIYIPDDDFAKMMKVHWMCLEKYHSIFDESIFILASNNEQNKNIDFAIEKINKIGFKNVKYKIVKNYPNIRESYYIKQELFDKLGDFDGLTFFGHSKGVSIRNQSNSEVEIATWISLMYFQNLNFIENVKQKLINENYISYGTLLFHNNTIYGKYKYFYSGTFFWINDKKLKEYMDKNCIQFPELTDIEDSRLYSEHSLSFVFPIEYAYTEQKIFNELDPYNSITDTLKQNKEIFHYEDFLNFYNSITQKIELSNKIKKTDNDYYAYLINGYESSKNNAELGLEYAKLIYNEFKNEIQKDKYAYISLLNLFSICYKLLNDHKNYISNLIKINLIDNSYITKKIELADYFFNTQEDAAFIKNFLEKDLSIIKCHSDFLECTTDENFSDYYTHLCVLSFMCNEKENSLKYAKKVAEYNLNEVTMYNLEFLTK